MKRGEVWWAKLPPPIGLRPVVLLSRDAAYARREFITIAPITSRIRGIQAEVILDRKDGLKKKSVVNLDTINTIPKAALDGRISSLSGEKMAAVEEAIRFALGFPYRPSDMLDLQGIGWEGDLDAIRPPSRTEEF
jgi:mRNA interferase MazF